MNPKSQIISNTILQKKTEIIYYQKSIKSVEKQIIKLKKELFSICNHEWIKDYDDIDSHCSWICKHCKLYKNTHYNF